MWMEFEDLWDRDRDERRLKPIDDPEAIKTNINKREIEEKIWLDEERMKNNEIIVNSKLNNMMIMFFRHQHILKILIIINVLGREI